MVRGKNYDAMDAAKFILSFFVVAIHANPLEGWAPGLIWPWVRAAVPLFFMFSGFLFFERAGRSGENIVGALGRFAVRSAKLYGAWLIVLSCIAGAAMGRSPAAMLGTPAVFLKNVVLGSTFAGSWFLSALVIGMVLIGLTGQRVGHAGLIALSAAAYLLCCAESSYAGLIEGTALRSVLGGYPDRLSTGFAFSLIWIALGRWMAERKRPLFACAGRRYAALAVSLAALAAEHRLTLRMGWQDGSEALVMLVPVCLIVLDAVVHARVRCGCARMLRELSVVIYCMNSVTAILLVRRGITGLTQFLATAAICLAAGFALRALSRLRGLRWLRCMY